jgi:DNA ligase (NAD+)
MDKLNRMKELVTLLNKASDAYYNTGKPIMSDMQYDDLYDELMKLEKDSKYKLSNTPTMNVGYEVKSKLNKVQHDIPLKSLGKTKDINELKKFIGTQEVVVMLKLDGLSNKLTYDNYGKLSQGSTRGNGVIGEDISHSVEKYKNVPEYIQGQCNVVGEAIIKQGEFNRINSKLPKEEQYKNSRNLVAGTIRSLDSKVTAQRSVRFYAFGIQNSWFETKVEELEWLKSQGFNTAPYGITTKDNIEEHIKNLREYAQENGFPIDGLVITYNNLAYGKSKGETSHHPLHSLAFKFGDSEEETILIDIEWSVGRTGVITPTSVFEPVELEGTTVERASVHNVSILKSLQLGYGDTIVCYKANQIIPQIKENLIRSNTIQIPNECPSCGHKTTIKDDGEAEFLMCSNPSCKAKNIEKVIHYCSRNAMNIEGLSDKTIEKFIVLGIITDIPSIYDIYTHKAEIVKLEGFGLKSFNKLEKAIEDSKKCKVENFLFALGIDGIGRSTSKDITAYFNNDMALILNAKADELYKIEGIGDITVNNYLSYFNNSDNENIVEKLIDILEFETEEPKMVIEIQDNPFKGKSVYPTGKFTLKKEELKAKLEGLGAIVESGYKKSLDMLIAGGDTSKSGKVSKAEKDGVKIVTEEFLMQYLK